MDAHTVSAAGTSTAERVERVRTWMGMALLAQARCLVLAGRALLAPLVLLVMAVFSVAYLYTDSRDGLERAMAAAVLVVLVPTAVFTLGRQNAAWCREQAAGWFGVRIPVLYRRAVQPQQDERGHWWTGFSYYRRPWVARAEIFIRTASTDPATHRDLLWLVGNAGAALLLALPCLLLTAVGAGTSLVLAIRLLAGDGPELGFSRLVLLFVVGLAAAVLGLWLAPRALHRQVRWARRVLDPQMISPLEAKLSERVQFLTTSRAVAVGTQAAELRRIERDLHDGAQARLVAIGMTLGTIEHLMDTDPAAARGLLGDAREASATALQELRDLVRGIHPPVLAERGLADAVRALALDSAQKTEVHVSLPARPEAPVEATAYFCVSELLANAAKHSGAQRIWVDILFRAGTLRITVTDDGRGGATTTRGSGLRGIAHRLDTFDGTLTLSSPLGGPTTATMELPCVLSSPRTSTSSGRG